MNASLMGGASRSSAGEGPRYPNKIWIEALREDANHIDGEVARDAITFGGMVRRRDFIAR